MNMIYHEESGKTSLQKEYLTFERYGMVDFIPLRNLNIKFPSGEFFGCFDIVSV